MKLLVSLLAILLAAAAPATAERASEREMMVLTVASLAATAGPRREIDRKVLEAMRQVPRHLLVPDAIQADAYQNRPLPIGYGATISQPYIVALMTDLLDVKPDHKVLEVGTGSGYQAAVLSGLVSQIYSIEIVQPLAKRAAEQLAALGYSNISVRAGDGYAGWPDQAPFDRIMVTAGADHVPPPLIEQLRPGGRMVVPVGKDGNLQLTVIDKSRKGRISKHRVLPVAFVPLTRESSSTR
jgi:protein-L-isoaspartate(D-aspartate) O-methyltransferase